MKTDQQLAIHDHQNDLFETLFERIHDTADGFQSLTPAEQHFYSVSVLINEVTNGGFNQFFDQSSSGVLCAALAGLEAIGATRARDLVLKAAQIVYPDDDSTFESAMVLPYGSPSPYRRSTLNRKATAHALDELEDLFYKEDLEDLRQKVTRFESPRFSNSK